MQSIGKVGKRSTSACAASSVPIRIGVNGGSLDKRFLEKYSAPTPEALAESALEEAQALESCGFSDIVISIKSSRTADMIKACRIVSAQSEHPLHIGVTEAGDEYSGLVKNCASESVHSSRTESGTPSACRLPPIPSAKLKRDVRY